MTTRMVRAALLIAAGLAVTAACSTEKLDTTTETTVRAPATDSTRASSDTTAPRSTGTTGAASDTTVAIGGDVTVAPDPTWALNASSYRGQNGLRLRVDCPTDGVPSSVWGTGTYTDDSSICNAAVHAGLITMAAGGRVVIEIAPGLQEYTGSDANGIVSTSYGPWDGSYTFVS